MVQVFQGFHDVAKSLRALGCENLIGLNDKDHIRIVDSDDHVITASQFLNRLVEFENIQRPGEVLQTELQMSTHDVRAPGGF